MAYEQADVDVITSHDVVYDTQLHSLTLKMSFDITLSSEGCATRSRGLWVNFLICMALKMYDHYMYSITYCRQGNLWYYLKLFYYQNNFLSTFYANYMMLSIPNCFPKKLTWKSQYTWIHVPWGGGGRYFSLHQEWMFWCTCTCSLDVSSSVQTDYNWLSKTCL